jgi:hypothetical protein
MVAVELGDPVPALALACALVPIVACIAAGSVIAPGHSRWPGADMLVGFGFLTGATAILAVTTPVPLSWLMVGVAILPVIALSIRRQIPGGRSTWIALALVSPILVKAAGSVPTAWDDFWNWLPSAAYEYNQNAIPKPGRAPSLAIFPGYPQGIPLMIAAASFIGGRFVETAGPIINVSLLAGSSAIFAEAIAAALIRHGRLQAQEMPLVVVVIAVAITVLLNPGLDGSVVLSSYADCGTMVAVGALALFGVEILARLSRAEPANAEGIAWRFGFVGAMLVNLKQANPVLLALIAVGLVLASFRQSALRTRALLQLPRMLGPGIIVFALWRWYVMHNLSDAEQTFRPLQAWYFDALPAIFRSIGIYIADAPLFHGLMWLVTAAGFAAFFHSPQKPDEARWLAVVCATVWLGYNAFLVTIYLGVMAEPDARGAADYWRYTPHVALLGLYPPVIALAGARWTAWLNLRSAVPALAMLLTALCILSIRRDLTNPPGMAWQSFLRTAAADMRHAIPPGSNVVIVSFTFPNALPFGVAVRYYLWQLDLPEQEIAINIRWDDRDLATVASLAARGQVDYLIIQDADGNMDMATDTLGLPRLKHELVLFVWRDNTWERVKSWPIPPDLITLSK